MSVPWERLVKMRQLEMQPQVGCPFSARQRHLLIASFFRRNNKNHRIIIFLSKAFYDINYLIFIINQTHHVHT
jgi:hypothetical protein